MTIFGAPKYVYLLPSYHIQSETFFRPDKTRKKEWMVQPVFCIVDAGSCYFIWSANELITHHSVGTFRFSRCLVDFALVIGDFFTCLLSTWSHASLGNSWRWRPVSRSYWWFFYEYWFYWFQLLTQTLKDLRPFDIGDCIKLFLRSSLTSWWTDHQEFVDQVSFVKDMYTYRLKPFFLNTKFSWCSFILQFPPHLGCEDDQDRRLMTQM